MKKIIPYVLLNMFGAKKGPSKITIDSETLRKDAEKRQKAMQENKISKRKKQKAKGKKQRKNRGRKRRENK